MNYEIDSVQLSTALLKMIACEYEHPAFDEEALDRLPTHLANNVGAGSRCMTVHSWNRLPDCCKGSWTQISRAAGNPMNRVPIALIQGELTPVHIVDAIRAPSVAGFRS